MSKHLHILGIGGSGASAIGAIAQEQGYRVTGCDKQPHNEFTEEVFEEAQLLSGHSADHLDGVDILAVTPAIFSLDPNNPELVEAKRLGIEVLTWQEFMGKYLEQDKFVIAVCGTHGKSTTTTMVGNLLEDAGFDPTVEVGAVYPKWGKNYRLGKSEYFVSEADEFNRNFLVTHPDIAIVTMIEMDHPESFKDFEEYKQAYIDFLSQTKKLVIANLADPGVAEVMKVVKKESNATTIDYSKSEFNLNLQVIGNHNLMNASAVFHLGMALGIEVEKIKQSLESFAGIGRRFEHMGRFRKFEVYSDFGHHPTELKVTLEAAREKFKDQKIWVVFQPHMFSRTKALFADFVKVIKEAPVNGWMIMDIYPSREVDTGLVTSKELVEAIGKDNVQLVSKGEEVLEELRGYTGEGIIIFLGAGSTHELAKKLVSSKA